MGKSKAVFCWSGGKDSSFALFKIYLEEEVEVLALLTTLNQEQRRISMHGVREVLLDAQAEAIGLPLVKAWVNEGTNEEYEKVMEDILLRLKEKGITHVIYGDIFLQDLRLYREKNLARIGLEAIFPLWEQDTNELMEEFLAAGFQTITCCVNDKYLDKTFCGEMIDENFVKRLPVGVDPCGENGEYHSFCYRGPIFKRDIKFSAGEQVYKKLSGVTDEEDQGFWYTDLVPPG